MVRSAGVVSVAVFMSRITGLLRESVMARLFGAGLIYDAFMLGFRIPNLTRDLFAEGALASAFVPTFSEYLSQRSKEEAVRLVNLVATALIIVVGAVCAAGMIFAPVLVHLAGSRIRGGSRQIRAGRPHDAHHVSVPAAGGSGRAGDGSAERVQPLRRAGPGIDVFQSRLGGIRRSSWESVLGPTLHLTRIEGMAIGVVLGGALQLIWQLPSLHRLGFRFRATLDWSDPGLQRILKLMVPAILGNAAVQINVMVNTNFASSISDPIRGLDGPVSWLSYAFRFMQLPLGLFGVAMASATLPSIARSVARGEMDEFRRTLSNSLGTVFLLTIPSSVGLVVLGKSIIGAIYQGGRFQLYDTQQTAVALSYYAIGLMGYAALKVLSPAFYALNDARTPMLVSLGSILVNYAVASTMIKFAGLGHAGLALSTSAVALFGFVVLFAILRKRIGGVYGRDLATQIGKVSLASAIMGAAIFASSRGMAMWLGVSQKARLADLAVSLPVGLAVYYVCCRALGLAEIDGVIRAFAGPIQRRLQRR